MTIRGTTQGSTSRADRRTSRGGTGRTTRRATGTLVGCRGATGTGDGVASLGARLGTYCVRHAVGAARSARRDAGKGTW